ncbi:hypothetical protein C8R43DRAFT_1119861 [Mycena crocata]|nr:hypothetical protein C8R43DRAFT_1119861 [Mycena crocata]
MSSPLLRPATNALRASTLGRPQLPLQLAHTARRHTHGHAEYQHLPFSTENKAAFAVKFISYLSLGFALPFIATAWQWYKPGGFKNP